MTGDECPRCRYTSGHAPDCHPLACDDPRCQRCYPAAMRADAPLPADPDVATARAILESLRREVHKAQREGRGGQHAGIARFAATRPTVLADLDRELGAALAALTGKDPT